MPAIYQPLYEMAQVIGLYIGFEMFDLWVYPQWLYIFNECGTCDFQHYVVES